MRIPLILPERELETEFLTNVSPFGLSLLVTRPVRQMDSLGQALLGLATASAGDALNRLVQLKDQCRPLDFEELLEELKRVATGGWLRAKSVWFRGSVFDHLFMGLTPPLLDGRVLLIDSNVLGEQTRFNQGGERKLKDRVYTRGERLRPQDVQQGRVQAATEAILHMVINLNDVHWLMAWADVSHRTVEIYDSSG